MDVDRRIENSTPEAQANFISKLFFCWLFPFLKYGYKNDIKLKDIYNITEKNSSKLLGDLLEKNWNIEVENANKRKKQPSLFRAIFKTFGLSYMKSGVWLLLHVTVRTFHPYILRQLLRSFQTNKTIDVETGWIFVIAIFLVCILSNLTFQQYSVCSQLVALRVQVACSSLMYRKILKLSQESLNQITPGEVVNLLSNDLQRIEQAAVNLHYIYAAPLQIVALAYIIYDSIGVACLPGILFIIAELHVQGFLSKIQMQLKLKIGFLTGERLATMNDIISGIRVIKLYAWEKPFEVLVEKARLLELRVITKSSYIKGLGAALMILTDKLTLFLIIMTYVLLGNALSADVVFSTAQLLNIVQAAVCFYLPQSFESCADFHVSMVRLQNFLLLSERVQKISTTAEIITEIGCIDLTNVTAGWLPTCLTLTDISLNVKPGTLCCIFGKSGAGNFLHLLLKELHVTSGNIDVTGRISYASQEAWLFVASVRNNILFGQKYLKNKYEEVIRVCSLHKDFQKFPQKDQTVIGDRGVSLSGGQRARVNLARVVYLDADIYLLDDPLSAVDSKVAKHLFEECISKYLQNKTRILVTHQLQFLRQADLIVILEEGKISKTMTKQEMSQNDLNLLGQLLPRESENVEENQFASRRVNRRISNISRYSTVLCDNEEDEEEEMIPKEVSFSTYINYFSSGTNVWFLILTCMVFITGQVITSMFDMWIRNWTNYVNGDSENTSSLNNTKINGEEQNLFYLYVSSGLALGFVILSIIRPMLLCTICLNTSRSLHSKMLKSVLRAPAKFFETNALGRVLNRFSKNMGSIDDSLPLSLIWGLQINLFIIGIIILVCIVNPWLTAYFLVAIIISYFIMTIFIPTLLRVSKLEATSCSPIFSHISSTINGLSTVRSARAEDVVKTYFESLHDVHTSIRHIDVVCAKSLAFYFELVFNILLTAIAFKFIIFRDENIQSGDIGLVLCQISLLLAKLQYGMIRLLSIFSSMEDVERVLQYINIETEENGNILDTEIAKKWPHSGRITFTNVCLSYTPGGNQVLNNLNFHIKSGEKIGIIGRTGAGKSSLITCLFRLTPIEGTITIDDVDISKIDLTTLRTNISIIPQEPVLFSGSLRDNIDPIGRVSDDTLWKVLERVNLKNYVDSLDQKITNGGSNFSVGQRQLVCLARAIVRNNKILIMDEATANLDTNTDALIQETIREQFTSRTVLTIAHRLNTVIDSDRVMLLNSGKIVEFAHPHDLLQNADSHFTQMVQEYDEVVEAMLRKIARDNFERNFFVHSSLMFSRFVIIDERNSTINI